MISRIATKLLLGQLDPSGCLQEVPAYSCDSKAHFMQAEALSAWLGMHASAKADGVQLQIISSFRSFGRQKEIWENKWYGITLTQGQNLAKGNFSDIEKARLILRYSAMPGTSRHHWGTDIDLNSVEPAYFETAEGIDVLNWLSEYAAQFGFVRPYTSKTLTGRTGYEEEVWHWSYIPRSAEYLRNYLDQIKYDDLVDFEGSHTAPELEVISTYVAGIDPACQLT